MTTWAVPLPQAHEGGFAAPPRPTRVSSMATLIIGSTTGPWMTSEVDVVHDRAAPSARRTAMPTASGVTP